jgi:hypothetical protein
VRLDDAFVIDETATPERLAQAVDTLERCTGSSSFVPGLVLRPSVREIRCDGWSSKFAAEG